MIIGLIIATLLTLLVVPALDTAMVERFGRESVRRGERYVKCCMNGSASSRRR